MTTTTNGTIPPGSSVIWHAHEGDFPAKIIGIMGIHPDTGEIMYSIDCPKMPGNSGIEASKITLDPPTPTVLNSLPPAAIQRLLKLATPEAILAMTPDEARAILNAASMNGNGHHEDEDIDDLINEASIPPLVDVLTAKIIEPLLYFVADYTGNARQAALDGLASMIGYLPQDERDALELPLLKTLFKAKKDLDHFLASCPPPPGTPTFALETLADLFNRPDKQWLIDQVIGAGDIAMIYGGPGSGKTFVGIDLIFAACLGQPWAMRFDVPRRLNVVYAAGEGISGLKERFKAAAVQYNVTDFLPGFSFSALVPQLFSDGVDAMYRFVAEWKSRTDAPSLDLLIIDTLHAATVGADENSAQDMGKVLAAAKIATRELGCAVLLVHHTNKAGTGERGSSAMRGAMDCMIEIRRISDTGTKAVMSCAKLKDGEAWKDQTFDLGAIEGCESVRVFWDAPSDRAQQNPGQKAADKAALKADMERYAGTRFTVKSLSEVIAKSENYTRNLISELEKSGDVKRDLSDPKKGYSPRNPWVYFVESLQEEAEKMGV